PVAGTRGPTAAAAAGGRAALKAAPAVLRKEGRSTTAGPAARRRGGTPNSAATPHPCPPASCGRSGGSATPSPSAAYGPYCRRRRHGIDETDAAFAGHGG